MTRRRGWAVAWLMLCLSGVGTAAAVPPGEVPAPLAPWVPWVLVDAPEHLCAFVGERALCFWPGRLELELDARGGRFAQRVLLDKTQVLALPGGAATWPLGVRADGHDVAVLDQAGVPSVELGTGEHRIEGRFEWSALPERLALPAQTATVTLRVADKSVAFPKRDEQGQLWLVGGGTGDERGEQLELSVARKIEDGVPLIVVTRIDLHVSGRAREVNLGRVLLEGTAPLAVQSELPARLEGSGELRLQVRAGKYRVEVRARSETSPAHLAYRSAGGAWPKSETWVWHADETLRQVELAGAPAIDPARTELDHDWRGLPTFVLRAGTSLALTSVRRGETSPPPNRVTLARDLWLDLDGSGYTVRDNIDATLRQGFRLDLLAGELGHVASGTEDLLITKSVDQKRAGVELRREHQALVAEWRASQPLSSLPAVAWSEDVQALSTIVHLGPGFSVFAVRGADHVSETWLQDWDLFGFFFVLLIAVAAGRLAGRPAALLALAALVVSHQEQEAPSAVWFALLAAIALLRVLPAGWFRNLVRAGFATVVVSLLVIAVPFAVDQIRSAIYPQLAQPWSGWTQPMGRFGLAQMTDQGGAHVPAAAPASIPERKVAEEPTSAESIGDLRTDMIVGSGVSGLAKMARTAAPSSPRPYDALRNTSSALQQDPEATVQMGPGVPMWQWRTWELHWSGPVDKAHVLQLYLISPLQNRVLSLLRVLLLATLIAVLLRSATPGRDRPGRATPSAPSAGSSVAVGLAALLACLVTLGVARSVHADLPDATLLDQLRTRLTKPAECRPSCASVDELTLDVSDAGLLLVAHVHAGERTSVRLPGPAATWVPAEIALDHQREAPVVLLEDGFLHVRVEPGVHVIEARGPLPETDALTLAFADRPHRARVKARGFKVDGVHEDGRVEQAVQLSRMLAIELGKPLQSAALPPWLLLERSIELGPSWEAHNRMTRVTATGTPIMVRVPLLAGELVTDSSLEVSEGSVQVSFGRDEQTIEWSSRLATSPRLELAASENKPWSERWTLLCGPIWHCEPSGLTPTHRVQNGRFELALVPWPGERVSLTVTRPPPAAGQSIAIDSADLEVTPGVRLLKATLSLSLRSSRGASQRVGLPANARVQSFSVDGQERPMRIEGRDIGFTLEPGAHAVKLQWQQAIGMGAVMRAPSVQLKRVAANARVTVQVPSDRWLLWTSGPPWGPAILFWGYLVIVLGAALLLGRVGHNPLRTHHWLLLALGLTQVPAPAALCIVGWFFAMAYRARMPEQKRWVHNLTQLALAFFTLSALGVLYTAVHAGLLMDPDMQVSGAGSSGNVLHWYADRSAGSLPTPAVWSAPLWSWRVLMLLWSLWLAASLVRWLPWAFGCFSQGGLWRKAPPRPPASPPVASP